MNTANALYANADGTHELVELDDTDCVYRVIAAITDEQRLAILAGETGYRATGHEVEVGDGDVFTRLEERYPEAGGRMAGAELAVWRHLLGLTVDELAEALGVNPRTARAWESGRDPVPARVSDELATLGVEHEALADRMVADGGPVAITRAKSIQAPRPRGWYVAAAARAMVVDPDLRVEWV